MKLARFLLLLLVVALGVPFRAAVNSSTTWVQYTLSTNPQALPVPFVFQVTTDVLVLDSKTSPPVTLTQNSDYTVSGGNGATGTVTTIVGGAHAVQVGDVITISRKVPLTQLTNYTNSGPLTAAMIGASFDKLTEIAQQLNLVGAASLQFQPDETLSGVLSKTARAGNVVGFDQLGRIQFYPPATTAITGSAAQFASVALLRLGSVAAVTNGTAVVTSGYYSAGDGGGGTFVWNSTSTDADNGGTIIQVTGVVTGRWLLSYSNSLSVKQFGAKCDGSTNDTTAINNAAAVGSAFLVFPTGTTTMASSVNPTAGQTWSGYGATLKMIASQPNFTRLVSIAYTGASDSNQTTIEGLTLDGNRDNQGTFTGGALEQSHCLFAAASGVGKLNLIVRDVTTRNSCGDGIALYTAISAQITNCAGVNCWRQAISVTGGGSTLQVANYRESGLGRVATVRYSGGIDIEEDSADAAGNVWTNVELVNCQLTDNLNLLPNVGSLIVVSNVTVGGKNGGGLSIVGPSGTTPVNFQFTNCTFYQDAINATSNEIARYGNCEFTQCTFVAQRLADDGGAENIYCLRPVPNIGADGCVNQTVTLTRCQFLYGTTATGSDTVIGLDMAANNTSGNNKVQTINCYFGKSLNFSFAMDQGGYGTSIGDTFDAPAKQYFFGSATSQTCVALIESPVTIGTASSYWFSSSNVAGNTFTFRNVKLTAANNTFGGTVTAVTLTADSSRTVYGTADPASASTAGFKGDLYVSSTPTAAADYQWVATTTSDSAAVWKLAITLQP